ncbi:13419_t:CDS:2 [Dentiscutata heterogama]|uniref:13419_t:CDS:1 n=1 Tax=Dentiscutata heterogama TaxID=1316150 RepID=A0ACA9LQI7_9GLOM|nr:13419_t:CDS:2 [Dentiscutata heterogama]
MSRARTSEIWWARILDRVDEFLHNYPKLPKKPLAESSLPLKIGSNITIKDYNTFLNNHGSSGFKFQFELNSDNKTGNVYIIGMTSTVHENVVARLQDFFKVPNGGVVDDPPINVSGQPLHYNPDKNEVQIAPDVYPDIAFVPRPAFSTGNPHVRIICEVAVGQNIGYLNQKCLTWMHEQYVRAIVSIKILKTKLGIREPTTGYFYRKMTAKLNRQGMATQRWDFGNVKKNSRDPIHDPAPCNAPNLTQFQINIPVGEVFWDPPFPIPPGYAPTIPPVIAVHNFTIDLYRLQRVALKAEM